MTQETMSCNENFQNTLASGWLKIMRMVNSKSPAVRNDGAIIAKIQLQETILQLKAVEEEIKSELRSTALQAKAAQAQNTRSTLQAVLQRSRAKRLRLTQTNKKRVNMEHQLEALAMSELNNQVLASMQKTSHALKALGVQNAVENAEEVMHDMQDVQQDITFMQDALGQSFSTDLDDSSLEEELKILLSPETDMPLDLPMFTNSMNETSSSTPAQLEVVVEESVVTDNARHISNDAQSAESVAVTEAAVGN